MEKKTRRNMLPICMYVSATLLFGCTEVIVPYTPAEVMDPILAQCFGKSQLVWSLPSHRNKPWTPLTKPVERASIELGDSERKDGIFVGLALSGGGSRAAVFGAEVMLALEELGVLQQVDVISCASGGCLPAAYYALSSPDDKTWNPPLIRAKMREDIRRKVEWQMWTNIRYWIGNLNRADLLARALDDLYIHGKTFADLSSQRPKLLIHGTESSTLTRFSFSEEQFESIASDLSAYPVSYTVAASSAFPGLIHPVTLRRFHLPYELFQKWLVLHPPKLEDIQKQRAEFVHFHSTGVKPEEVERIEKLADEFFRPVQPEDVYRLRYDKDKKRQERCRFLATLMKEKLERKPMLKVTQIVPNEPPTFLHLTDGGVSDNLAINNLRDVIHNALLDWRRLTPQDPYPIRPDRDQIKSCLLILVDSAQPPHMITVQSPQLEIFRQSLNRPFDFGTGSVVQYPVTRVAEAFMLAKRLSDLEQLRFHFPDNWRLVESPIEAYRWNPWFPGNEPPEMFKISETTPVPAMECLIWHISLDNLHAVLTNPGGDNHSFVISDVMGIQGPQGLWIKTDESGIPLVRPDALALKRVAWAIQTDLTIQPHEADYLFYAAKCLVHDTAVLPKVLPILGIRDNWNGRGCQHIPSMVIAPDGEILWSVGYEGEGSLSK